MSKASLNLERKIIEVQQYSTVDSVTFSFNRYMNNGIDLASLTSMIIMDSSNIIKSNIEENEFLIQLPPTNTKVNLIWSFDSFVTKEPGEYRFQIVFSDGEGNAKAYTEVGKLIINDSLDVEIGYFSENLSLLQQWEQGIKNNLNEEVNNIKNDLNNELSSVTSNLNTRIDNVTDDLNDKITILENNVNSEISPLKTSLNEATTKISNLEIETQVHTETLSIVLDDLDASVIKLSKLEDAINNLAFERGASIQIVEWGPDD